MYRPGGGRPIRAAGELVGGHQDWKSKDADKILDIIYRQVSGSDIVLLHDRYQNTVDAVLALMPHLQGQGYVFVTVSELLALKVRTESVSPTTV